MERSIEARAVTVARRAGVVGVLVGLGMTGWLWLGFLLDGSARSLVHVTCVGVALVCAVRGLGRWAAHVLLRRDARSGTWMGPLSGLCILGAVAAGIVVANGLTWLPGEVSHSSLPTALEVYVERPVLLLLVYGTLPALAVGLGCGVWMRKRIARLLTTSGGAEGRGAGAARA